MDTWKILRESLIPYFIRLKPGMRVFYEKLIDEIFDMLDTKDLNKALDSVYLLGYSHQRTAIFTSTKAKTEGDKDNESADEQN